MPFGMTLHDSCGRMTPNPEHSSINKLLCWFDEDAFSVERLTFTELCNITEQRLETFRDFATSPSENDVLARAALRHYMPKLFKIQVNLLERFHSVPSLYTVDHSKTALEKASQLLLFQKVGLITTLIYAFCTSQFGRDVYNFFPSAPSLLHVVLANAIEVAGTDNASCSTDTRKRLFSVHEDQQWLPENCIEKTLFYDVSWKYLVVLNLWLSLLVLSPLDLNKASMRLSGDVATIIDDIFCLTLACLRLRGPVRDSAVLVASNALARRDVLSSGLAASYFKECQNQLYQSSDESLLKQKSPEMDNFEAGVLKVIKKFLKKISLKNEEEQLELINAAEILKSYLATSCLPKSRASLKDAISGLSYLGMHLLEIQNSTQKDAKGTSSDSEIENALPPAATALHQLYDIDSIIAELVNHLSAQNLSVLWKVAQSIGRICTKLHPLRAQQITHFLLSSVKPESENSRELTCGIILSLAQIAVKRCLLAEDIVEVANVAYNAILFESSLEIDSKAASPIIESACYICWCLFRDRLLPCSSEVFKNLKTQLLLTTCFDVNVNSRRAAAAVLQELVGRYRNVQHGLGIICCATFFSITSTTEAYLSVAPKVAQLTCSEENFMFHLIELRSQTSNYNARSLSSHALFLIGKTLSSSRLQVLVDNLNLQLRLLTATKEATRRHGIMLCMASSVDAITELLSSKPNIIDAKLQESLEAFPRIMLQSRPFLGRGGELCREGLCRVISSMSRASSWLSIKPASFSTTYARIVFECLSHPSSYIQIAAAEAVTSMSYLRASTETLDEWLQLLISRLSEVEATTSARSGSLLALAYFNWEPVSMQRVSWLVQKLCKEAVTMAPLGNSELKDPVCRQSALLALGLIVHAKKHLLTFQEGQQLHSALLIAAKDYEVDSRGDVGAMVRSVSLDLMAYFLLNDSDYMPPSHKDDFIQSILRQLFDKLDSLRSKAAFLLHLCVVFDKYRLTKGTCSVTSLVDDMPELALLIHYAQLKPLIACATFLYSCVVETLLEESLQQLNAIDLQSPYAMSIDCGQFIFDRFKQLYQNWLQASPNCTFTNLDTSEVPTVNHPQEAMKFKHDVIDSSPSVKAAEVAMPTLKRKTLDGGAIVLNCAECSAQCGAVGQIHSPTALFCTSCLYRLRLYSNGAHPKKYRQQAAQPAASRLKQYSNAKLLLHQLIPLVLHSKYRLHILAGICNESVTAPDYVASTGIPILLEFLSGEGLHLSQSNFHQNGTTNKNSTDFREEFVHHLSCILVASITMSTALEKEITPFKLTDIQNAFAAIPRFALLTAIFALLASFGLDMCGNELFLLSSYFEKTLQQTNSVQSVRLVIDVCAILGTSTAPEAPTALRISLLALKHRFASCAYYAAKALYTQILLLASDSEDLIIANAKLDSAAILKILSDLIALSPVGHQDQKSLICQEVINFFHPVLN